MSRENQPDEDSRLPRQLQDYKTKWLSTGDPKAAGESRFP